MLTSKDEPLLIWRDSLLVLDLRLHILDRVRGLNLDDKTVFSWDQVGLLNQKAKNFVQVGPHNVGWQDGEIDSRR